MNVTVWQTIVLVAVLASGDAYLLKREPFTTGLLAVGFWLIAALGALNVESPVQGPDVVAQAEYAVAVLCLLVALVSLVVVLKAAVGAYDDEERDHLASTVGDHRPTFEN